MGFNVTVEDSPRETERKENKVQSPLGATHTTRLAWVVLDCKIKHLKQIAQPNIILVVCVCMWVCVCMFVCMRVVRCTRG